MVRRNSEQKGEMSVGRHVQRGMDQAGGMGNSFNETEAFYDQNAQDVGFVLA